MKPSPNGHKQLPEQLSSGGTSLLPDFTLLYSPTDEPYKTQQYDALVSIGRSLLVAIGEDPDRPGLVDTPARFARSWLEFVHYAAGSCDTVFEAVTEDQMVIVKGIRVWSYCEHHLLPFSCDLDIAYIANERVLGLSKFARIAHRHAHRLQIQERLIENIADEISEVTGSKDVAVVARGVHTCMVMRGIKTDGVMISRVMRGLFQEPETRQEFLSLVAAS